MPLDAETLKVLLDAAAKDPAKMQELIKSASQYLASSLTETIKVNTPEIAAEVLKLLQQQGLLNASGAPGTPRSGAATEVIRVLRYDPRSDSMVEQQTTRAQLMAENNDLLGALTDRIGALLDADAEDDEDEEPEPPRRSRRRQRRSHGDDE